ncbi:MAG: hypothetical protein V3V97_22170 [Hyphomicrobiaceae bacterium]
MKVTIKSFDVGMEVKNKGIEFEVRSADDSKQLGDLVLTKSGLTWCEGRTKPENGIKLGWGAFIKMMNSKAK